MKQYKTVDEYIKNASEDIQPKLNEIRKIIINQAPQAKESMSYGMAYYSYKGKLLYFGYFKKHIGLYIPGSVIKNHLEELKDYTSAKATIRFPLDKDLPISLITKLVKARIKEVEEKK